MTQIVLHACCAVCAGYPLNLLPDIGYQPIVYFFNPNIHPQEEYSRRLQELIKYCQKKGYQLIVEEEDSENWFNYIKGLENEPERGLRCKKCFEYRLFKTAQKTKELGLSKFTTTLFISPHKIRQDIINAGKKAAAEYSIDFIDIDFRKKDGFLKTMKIAKEENFYRQNYCGCVYANKSVLKV